MPACMHRSALTYPQPGRWCRLMVSSGASRPTGASVMLQVLKGTFGANKTYWVKRPAAKGVVLFFPGDQIEHASAPEIRELQDPKVQTELMASKFPECSSVLVMPSRVEGSFACFDHFLNKVTRSGEPLGYQGSSYKASLQITSLLQASQAADSRDLVYHLVGFSKGGVVLNQVLSEVAACREHSDSLSLEAVRFLQSVGEVHFLDVGLNCRGAYLTDPQIVHSLSQAAAEHCPNLSIHLHGTPRQWEDKRRPWVRQEKERFKALLLNEHLPMQEHRYFNGQDPTLLMHFEAIRDMQRPG